MIGEAENPDQAPPDSPRSCFVPLLLLLGPVMSESSLLTAAFRSGSVEQVKPAGGTEVGTEGGTDGGTEGGTEGGTLLRQPLLHLSQ